MKNALLLLLGFAVLGDIRANRVPYGGHCNTTTRCNTRAWLRCSDEGRCTCMKPEEMLFDESAGECVIKAGERCVYAMGEKDSDNRVLEVHTCVNDSACSSNGFCTCNPGFFETSEGTCTQAKGLKEACNGTVKCSSIEGLECQDGLCQCDSGKSEFSGVLSHCVGLVGHRCIRGYCTAHANCATNMCVCDENYYWDLSGRCTLKSSVMGNCSADFHCGKLHSAQLVCIGGVCNCDAAVSIYATVSPSRPENYDGNSYYGFMDSSYTACVPLVGLPCLNRLCAPGSYCSKKSRHFQGLGLGGNLGGGGSFRVGWSLGSGGGLGLAGSGSLNGSPSAQATGVCECVPGLTEKNGICARGFNISCNATADCIESLVCKNKQCSCEYDIQVYNESEKSCKSKVRGRCKGTDDCLEHAYCQITESGAGHCTCSPGYVPNSYDRCEVAMGKSCSAKTDCDSVASLDCINGTCRCGSFGVYQEESRKCVGMIGAKCNPYEGNSCVRHSHCRVSHPKLPPSCTCEEGFVEAANYTCVSPATLFGSNTNGSSLIAIDYVQPV